MKKVFAAFLVIGILLFSSFAFAEEYEEGMAKWQGVNRVDAFGGAKGVFTPKGTAGSVNAHVIVYPWLWQTENGINLLGVGFKMNYWDSPGGYGQRPLGETALRIYREWGSARFSFLGGIQKERYGKSEPPYTLFGLGIYFSLNHNEEFPKTEFWGQVLKANGGKMNGIIDVGGRQYLVKDGIIKPYIEANLSIGTPDNYASLGIAIGITDRREIFYLSAGPQLNLKSGGAFLFVNAGVSTSNAVDAAIRANEASGVVAVVPVDQKQQENDTPKE
jgi:hypothetical protein